MQNGTESILSVVEKYLARYLENFRKNLDTARTQYDPEAIHEYRVAVKRIRAITSAVNQSLEEPLFPDDLIAPLRMMFKAGGTIRDHQVQLVLVEELEENSGKLFPLIREYYRIKIENQRNRFFNESVDFEYPVIDEIRLHFDESLETLNPQDFEALLYLWLKVAMDRLKRNRYDLENPVKLHRFRTRYKQVGYVAEMLYQSEFDFRISKSAYTRMKDFGQELGNWHDHYQLWSKTAVIFQESREVGLAEEAFEMRKLIMPRHDKLFQEILHLIKRDDSLFVI